MERQVTYKRTKYIIIRKKKESLILKTLHLLSVQKYISLNCIVTFKSFESKILSECDSKVMRCVQLCDHYDSDGRY